MSTGYDARPPAPQNDQQNDHQLDPAGPHGSQGSQGSQGAHDSQGRPPAPSTKPVTLRTLHQMAAQGRPFACLTAYDFTTARWLARAGVHLLLVGDSAANVVLGFDSTIHMPLDLAIALTAAVKRGAPGLVVMADMPFMSYHCGDDDALRNAARFMTQGLADIVKLEADASWAPTVARLARAGVPVCAHIGTRPQSAALTSGPRASGLTAADARALADDAHALELAGASMLLVEAVPPQAAELILARTSLPVIGIGAGPACHGQILVVNDLLGLTDRPPRFAEPAAALGPDIQRAAAEWVRRVADRATGGQPYAMPPAEAARLTHP